MITAGGKNIAPQYIENMLKFSPYINDAIVVADGRKFVTALIMLDEENVAKYAQDNKVPFTTYKSLTNSPDIIKSIWGEIEKVNDNLANVEKIKEFRNIDVRLTVDDEEMTSTLKLKRKYIMDRFGYLVDSMYGR